MGLPDAHLPLFPVTTRALGWNRSQALPDGKIFLQPMNRAFANRNVSLLTSLSKTRNQAGINIDVTRCQRAQLRNSQTRGIHQFQHCPIANTLICLDIGSIQQTVNLVFSKLLRQISHSLRSIKVLSRVPLDMPVEH